MKKELKNIIKGFIYSDFMVKPRFYFRKRKIEQSSIKLGAYIKTLELKPKKKIFKIAFILKYPEIWNSSRTVFESFLQMENVELLIIAIPKNKDDNPAYTFAKEFFKNVISWDDYKDYSALDIDYVFFTRPYDGDYPNGLKPNFISRYSKICYIPYGFEFVTGYHIEVEYDYKFLPYASMIFCEGDSSYNYCRRILPEATCTKLYKIGFPRFDLLDRYKKTSNAKKTILWTPRWSLERLANDGTSFFDFMEPLLSFFSQEEMHDYNLIIRPHPLMFNNFIKNGVMTEKEITELKNRVSLCENISFDNDHDYLLTAAQADLIISDFSGMLIEFLMLNKAIIYCGKSNSFDETGIKMNSVMYHINEKYDVISSIGCFLNQGDVLKEKREKFIAEMQAGSRMDAGKRIAREVLKDYRKE